MASPDPVTDGAGYQRMLLALLGSDDPAAVQAATPGAVDAIITDAGSALRLRPAEGEWSVLELIGHLADAELVVGGRYRWTIAHEQPPLLGYDQDLWVAGLRHNDDDPKELASLFRALRHANLALWRRATPAQRERVGMHSERGPESYDLQFRLLAGHDRFHLDQMRKTLAAVKPPVQSSR
jgi:hypothetical protein